MSTDLDIPKRTVIDAIERLERASLIRRTKGGGRGHSSRYHLCFLCEASEGKAAPETIEWVNNQCGPPHRLSDKTVRSSVRNSAVHRIKTVRPTAHEKKENYKNERPPAAADGAGGALRQKDACGPVAHVSSARTADDAFAEAHEARLAASGEST